MENEVLLCNNLRIYSLEQFYKYFCYVIAYLFHCDSVGWYNVEIFFLNCHVRLSTDLPKNFMLLVRNVREISGLEWCKDPCGIQLLN